MTSCWFPDSDFLCGAQFSHRGEYASWLDNRFRNVQIFPPAVFDYFFIINIHTKAIFLCLECAFFSWRSHFGYPYLAGTALKWIRKGKVGRESVNVDKENVNVDRESNNVDREMVNMDRDSVDVDRKRDNVHMERVNVDMGRLNANRESVNADTERVNVDDEAVNTDKETVNADKEKVNVD